MKTPLFLLLPVSIFWVMLISGCGEHQEPIIEEKIRPVRVVPASQVPMDIQRRFAGTIHSASTSNLSFRISGTIAEFPATVGVPLEKDTLIARLDNNDLQLKLEQSQAALELASVSAEKAESRYLKVKALYEKQLISEIDYESAEAEFKSGKAQVRQTQRSVELSKEQLSYADLRAPSDKCSITEAVASKNENVASGQTIAVLSCGTIMEASAMVSEGAIGNVHIGQPVKVYAGKIQPPFSAQITEIGINSSTNGGYFVTARLNDISMALRPGLTAELVIPKQFHPIDNHLWVPMIAVGEENHKKFVMVYEPRDGLLGVVKKVTVKTDRFAMGSIEITDGLKEGQLVITAGLSQIYDGLTVKQQHQTDRPL